jgi:WD40 repeat protein
VTGQTGQQPIIFVWDAVTGKVIAEKKLPKGSEYVTAICISPDENKICAADSNPKGVFVHTISIKDAKAEPVETKIN